MKAVLQWLKPAAALVLAAVLPACGPTTGGTIDEFKGRYEPLRTAFAALAGLLPGEGGEAA